MMARSQVVLGLAALAALASASALGCAPTENSTTAGNPALAPFARERLAEDVPHSSFVDFGGKLQLVGYDISPLDAPPGTQVHLKFYWRRSGSLDAGWNLFTHLEDERGHQLGNIDRDGAFRTAVTSKPDGLSALALGKIYTDEQTFQMPKDVTPRVTLVVGAWLNDPSKPNAAGTRLPVVSGQTNGQAGAIVANLMTGVQKRVHRLALPQG
jgi:hypothetical protein